MFPNLFGSRKANPAVAAITPAALKRRLDAGEHLYLLDVRSSEEYAYDGQIAGARGLFGTGNQRARRSSRCLLASRSWC